MSTRVPPDMSDPADQPDPAPATHAEEAPLAEEGAAPEAPRNEEEQADLIPIRASLPTPEELADDIADAVGCYVLTTRALARAEIDLLRAQDALAGTRAAILLSVEDPKALGSNEAARAATLDNRTAAERAAVLDLECKKRDAAGAREITTQLLRRHEMMLRILELQCPVAPAASPLAALQAIANMIGLYEQRLGRPDAMPPIDVVRAVRRQVEGVLGPGCIPGPGAGND